ncbi:hypothetical protein ACEW7V_00710 [Areca yellow leaf disease phytoplasma]
MLVVIGIMDFYCILGNIITVWANNPLKEILATGVIEKKIFRRKQRKIIN